MRKENQASMLDFNEYSIPSSRGLGDLCGFSINEITLYIPEL